MTPSWSVWREGIFISAHMSPVMSMSTFECQWTMTSKPVPAEGRWKCNLSRHSGLLRMCASEGSGRFLAPVLSTATIYLCCVTLSSELWYIKRSPSVGASLFLTRIHWCLVIRAIGTTPANCRPVFLSGIIHQTGDLMFCLCGRDSIRLSDLSMLCFTSFFPPFMLHANLWITSVLTVLLNAKS